MGQFKKLGFIEETSGVLHVNPAVFTSLTIASDASRSSHPRRFQRRRSRTRGTASGGMMKCVLGISVALLVA
jgi:hypothetical protein